MQLDRRAFLGSLLAASVTPPLLRLPNRVPKLDLAYPSREALLYSKRLPDDVRKMLMHVLHAVRDYAARGWRVPVVFMSLYTACDLLKLDEDGFAFVFGEHDRTKFNRLMREGIRYLPHLRLAAEYRIVLVEQEGGEFLAVGVAR